jgi:hypothetical protein
MSRRRGEERRALALARAQGCRCRPSISWHPIVVGGRAGEAIRLGHDLDCPRLFELRRQAGEEPLSCDVFRARLWVGEGHR